MNAVDCQALHLAQGALLLAALVALWAGYLHVRLRQVLLLVRAQEGEMEQQQGVLLDLSGGQQMLRDSAEGQAHLELRLRAVEAWGAEVVDPALRRQVQIEGLLAQSAQTQQALSRVQKVQQDLLDLLLPDRTAPAQAKPN